MLRWQGTKVTDTSIYLIYKFTYHPDNNHHLHAVKFTHMWHKGFLPKVFDNLFQYAKSTYIQHKVRIKANFCKPCIRNNTGKQMFSCKSIDLWHDIPLNLKDLSTFSSPKK